MQCRHDSTKNKHEQRRKKMSRELFFDMFCLGCDSLESVKVVLGVILKWKSRSFMSYVFESKKFHKSRHFITFFLFVCKFQMTIKTIFPL